MTTRVARKETHFKASSLPNGSLAKVTEHIRRQTRRHQCPVCHAHPTMSTRRPWQQHKTRCSGLGVSKSELQRRVRERFAFPQRNDRLSFLQTPPALDECSPCADGRRSEQHRPLQDSAGVAHHLHKVAKRGWRRSPTEPRERQEPIGNDLDRALVHCGNGKVEVTQEHIG